MTLLINRRRVVTACAIILVAIVVAAWYLNPDRRLARSWRDLIAAVEARNPTRLRQLLSEDYRDRWGHSRDSLTSEARLAFFQVRELAVKAEQVSTRRAGDAATISAVLRIQIEGGPGTTEARVHINSIFTPFLFEWRRAADFPWDWRLVRFDQPELVLMRIRRASDLPGL